MPFGNLSEQFISESFQVLVQADITQNPVTFADGLGNPLGIVTNIQTGSFLTELPSGLISSSVEFVTNAQTGSFITELPSGVISSSAGFVKTVNSITPDQDGDVVITTTEISEDTNLYYTDARVKAKLNAENVISSSMIVATASFVAIIDGGSF